MYSKKSTGFCLLYLSDKTVAGECGGGVYEEGRRGEEEKEDFLLFCWRPVVILSCLDHYEHEHVVFNAYTKHVMIGDIIFFSFTYLI